jgi:hypothetical protein
LRAAEAQRVAAPSASTFWKSEKPSASAKGTPSCAISTPRW